MTKKDLLKLAEKTLDKWKKQYGELPHIEIIPNRIDKKKPIDKIVVNTKNKTYH